MATMYDWMVANGLITPPGQAGPLGLPPAQTVPQMPTGGQGVGMGIPGQGVAPPVPVQAGKQYQAPMAPGLAGGGQYDPNGQFQLPGGVPQIEYMPPDQGAVIPGSAAGLPGRPGYPSSGAVGDQHMRGAQPTFPDIPAADTESAPPIGGTAAPAAAVGGPMSSLMQALSAIQPPPMRPAPGVATPPPPRVAPAPHEMLQALLAAGGMGGQGMPNLGQLIR